jgi:hypothetical protein
MEKPIVYIETYDKNIIDYDFYGRPFYSHKIYKKPNGKIHAETWIRPKYSPISSGEMIKIFMARKILGKIPKKRQLIPYCFKDENEN